MTKKVDYSNVLILKQRYEIEKQKSDLNFQGMFNHEMQRAVLEAIIEYKKSKENENAKLV